MIFGRYFHHVPALDRFSFVRQRLRPLIMCFRIHHTVAEFDKAGRNPLTFNAISGEKSHWQHHFVIRHGDSERFLELRIFGALYDSGLLFLARFIWRNLGQCNVAIFMKQKQLNCWVKNRLRAAKKEAFENRILSTVGTWDHSKHLSSAICIMRRSAFIQIVTGRQASHGIVFRLNLRFLVKQMVWSFKTCRWLWC